MRMALLLAGALAATAAPAAVLTCARPDPLAAFRAAQDSPDSYVVLRGSLDFDAGLIPQPGLQTPPGDVGLALGAPEMLMAGVPATFQGEGLTPAGWERSAVVLAALATILLLTLIALLAAGPLMRKLGARIEAVITRLLGVLLAALAVQFVVDGLQVGFGIGSA